MEKTILILGGQGFIGSHLVALALTKKYRVTVLSLTKKVFPLSLPNDASLEHLIVNATVLDDLKHALDGNKFHYVINCSGYIDHSLYKDGGRRLIDQHFTTVLNLIECLDRGHLEGFAQIGSSDEYGNLPAPQSEDYRETPIAPYSFGKAATTHFLQMLSRTEAFPAIILRLFLVYGPAQNRQRFLPQIIQGCLEDQAFPTSAGEQLRDFCYVGDIARGIFKALKSPQAHGEVINLASGNGISIRKMIETTQEMIGSGHPKFGEFPYRPGENMALYACIEKAKRLLNWKPQISLEQGLQKTIRYYQEQSTHEK